MRLYTLERRQELPIALEEAWKFFATPYNLQTITPSTMQFRITNAPEPQVYAGQIITYIVKPFFNIPLRWVTEITHVEAPYYFADEQRSGPYRFWHHKHFFKETASGIEMRDLVHYALPLSFLSHYIEPWLVGKRLEGIFDFRRQKLEELFPVK